MTTTLLMLIGATLAGGLISLFATRIREGSQHLMVAVSAGLVLGALIFHLVPELFSSTAQSVGDATTGFVIGFLVMLAWGIYRSKKAAPDSAPHTQVWLSALTGMSVHAITAGLGLALFLESESFAVLLIPFLWHKATEGLSLASLMQLSEMGAAKMVGYLALFSLATPAGVLLGQAGIGGGDGLFAGLAAGSFLYVVLFNFLPEAFQGEGSRALRGVALSIGLLIGSSVGHGHVYDSSEAERVHGPDIFSVLGEGWLVLTQMAPWLLGGFFIAGVLSQVLDTERIGRWLGKGGVKSVVGAALVGAPLPLCSCSVLPVATSLRKEGASRGATSAFLISTPETGVDSVSVTWGLLGPFMAITRFLSSIITAIVTGLAVNFTPEDKEPAPEALPSCCMHPEEEPAPKSCCETEAAAAKGPGFLARVFRYAYVDMMDDLAETLLLGLALAALAAALLPAEVLDSAVMSGPGAYFLMLIIGVPLYVCASASTPIAAALIAKGLSPGAALVFLLAGPATNLATVAVLKKALGSTAAVVHLATLALMTLTFGFLVDSWGIEVGLLETIPCANGHAHHQHTSFGADLLGSSAALLLLALIGAALWRGAKGQEGAHSA
ncbi:MAG: SO_0444 family Cu/Zn efflux transporter [Planctomycetes bacterium]|nr:SO_0444 family Cu/Zn efflux transporter [Planctomycetota bacterium]